MNKEEIIERIEKYFDGITPEELLTKMIRYGFETEPHVCKFTSFVMEPGKKPYVKCKCGKRKLHKL